MKSDISQHILTADFNNGEVPNMFVLNFEPNSEHLWAIDVNIWFRYCAHTLYIHYWSQNSRLKMGLFHCVKYTVGCRVTSGLNSWSAVIGDKYTAQFLMGPLPSVLPMYPQYLYTGMCCTQWHWLWWWQSTHVSWESLRSVMSSCHLVPGWDTSAQGITWGNLVLKTSPLFL